MKTHESLGESEPSMVPSRQVFRKPVIRASLRHIPFRKLLSKVRLRGCAIRFSTRENLSDEPEE